ncbi:MAG: 30S ribosomal protein S6 [Terriglobia bacterium]
MMRHYEIMFIVKPTSTDEDVDKLIAQMEGVVKSYEGEVVAVDKMGRRKLAYRIDKSEEGVYVLFKINASGECVKEFERRLRVIDFVIRYISVRVDEDLKRMEKIKAARLKKIRKKTAGTATETPAPAI